MIFYLLVPAIVLLDQFSKFIAVKYLEPVGSYPLIQNIFHLTFVKNDGAAFSIFSSKQLFLIIVTAVVICLILGLLVKSVQAGANPWLNLSLALVAGGAIGNLIDRIRLNYVIDYFEFKFVNFAIFNVADVFIVLGTALMCYLVLFKNIELKLK
jgi:signal peptidase II